MRYQLIANNLRSVPVVASGVRNNLLTHLGGRGVSEAENTDEEDAERFHSSGVAREVRPSPVARSIVLP